jgi:hypothetical protein
MLGSRKNAAQRAKTSWSAPLGLNIRIMYIMENNIFCTSYNNSLRICYFSDFS